MGKSILHSLVKDRRKRLYQVAKKNIVIYSIYSRPTLKRYPPYSLDTQIQLVGTHYMFGLRPLIILDHTLNIDKLKYVEQPPQSSKECQHVSCLLNGRPVGAFDGLLLQGEH